MMAEKTTRFTAHEYIDYLIDNNWKIQTYDSLIKMLDKYNISISFDLDANGEPINYEIQTQSEDWGIHFRR